jgi:hypothetical protein
MTRSIKPYLKVSLEGDQGGFGPGCSCDGNDEGYGFDSRSKTISADGSVEQWSGCLKRASSVNDPNKWIRCHTYKVMNSVIEPARWSALKKSILAANPLSLAEHYPCGSYLDCPSDVGGAGLTINIGQAQRAISWPAGEESQLPATFQFILSVLP